MNLMPKPLLPANLTLVKLSAARRRAVMSAAVGLALLVGACVPSGAAPSASAPQGTTAGSAGASGGSGTSSIALWHIQSAGTGPKIIQQAVDRFHADNPNVNVEVVPLQNDPYKTKIKLAVGAGKAPCVFLTWGGGPLYEYVKANQVIDLTPYMTKDNYKDRFVDAAFTPITFDGKIYGVPVENTAMAVIFYNKVLFQKYNLTPPKTWDELLNVVKTLKDNKIAAFALANKGKWPGSMYFMYLVDRLGGPQVFQSAATRTGGSFEDPVFIQAGTMIEDLVKAGAFAEGLNGLDNDTGQARALLYSGKAAMELMGTWEISSIKGENPDYYNNSLGLFPFPTVPNGKGDPNDLVGTAGDNFYSISPTCSNPDAAFRLIQYLIDDTSVKIRAEDGRIPPVKGFTATEPLLKEVVKLIEAAPNVQLWYDQYLPPEVGEVHKDTSQALFGLSMTPQEAAKQLEDAAKAYFGE